MVQQITGNILDVQEGIIVHQVNCRGVMNSGLAKQIRNKYPEVYVDYIHKYTQEGWLLGDVLLTCLNNKLSIASCAGQDNYGRSGVFTDYSALRICLNKLALFKQSKIYIPYQMGCEVGGGNWDKVRLIIEEFLPDAIIVKKD